MSAPARRNAFSLDGKLLLSLDECTLTVPFSKEFIRQQIKAGNLVAKYGGTKPVVAVDELQRWAKSLPDESPRA